METIAPEPAKAAPPSAVRFVFFNPRGPRAGWRLLIFTAIIGGIGGAFYLAVRPLLSAPPPPARDDLQRLLPLFQGIGDLVVFLFVLLVSWLMSLLEKRKVGDYGLPAKGSALRQMLSGYILWGFLPLTLNLLAMRALGVFYFGHLGLHGIQILTWGLLWGFCFLMVAIFEEFFFRGYALYTLADGIGFWPAAIIMALIFGRAHMGNGGETYIGIVGTILFAVFASATLWRTGNLWLAVGAHAGWDWGQSFFYGVNDSGLQAPGHLLDSHVQGPIWLTGGSVGPEGSIVTLIFLILMTTTFLLIYRDRKEKGRPEGLPVKVGTHS